MPGKAVVTQRSACTHVHSDKLIPILHIAYLSYRFYIVKCCVIVLLV